MASVRLENLLKYLWRRSTGISFIDELPDWSYLIPVEMELCHQHVTEDEEPVSEETCVLMDCPSPSGFSVGVWSETCTGDPCDVQTREVTCTRKSPPCDEQEKPLESRTCGEIQCGSWEIDEWSREACEDWSVDEWSDCDQLCGPGLEHRTVSCPVKPCNPSSRPKAIRPCFGYEC
ncbi:unnamed protein product [Notodromas monacha]|uniref:Uncharacterized protein n=1 Tax=Notodromas monacha TaxID=399045 RepID=A0A7R9BXD4_9CRUS|nr:unnamed protein product [Notodromas monacha]CAG0923118.1 unnamed protein product [Notodromas monacha]